MQLAAYACICLEIESIVHYYLETCNGWCNFC